MVVTGGTNAGTYLPTWNGHGRLYVGNRHRRAGGGFDLVRSRYPDVAEILSGAKGFGGSPEYKSLSDTERSLPGVVAGAFARYLGRCWTQRRERPSPLGRCIETLELLASWRDVDVDNLIQVEVYETLTISVADLAEFRGLLGEGSRLLFDDWHRRQP